ncbi:kinase [Fragilaria crotonensis]|nr:kinase [Fragilaria crotonensis]
MSSCETSLVVPPEETAVTSLLPTDSLSNSSRSTLKQKVIKALRMFARVVKLAVALTPLLLLYPLLHRKPPQKDAHELALSSAETEKLSWFSQFYLNRCVRNVEWSGAAVVKLMQWLSSRPDLVGHEFCSIFQRLQDDTTPHAWKYTEQALQDAYGNDWRDKIRIDKLIGSGCIGQVYKGYVKLPSSVEEVPVAIKVLHPSIDQDMETDLNLMRFAADVIPRIWEPLSWLNPQGAVEEFGRMLMLQLDLRYEARNLQRFNRDFERDADKVIFPKLVPEFHATHNVLVETFIEGLPILSLPSATLMTHIAAKVMCNVLVTNDHRLALLDVGIVNEYTDMDHQLIVDILTSFIRYDGRTAGRLMVDNSKARVGSALEEELFVDKMDALSQLARGSNYLMEHLGSYISQICEAAATHHVLMNQSFVSAALAIKVQEGIVLSLDPNMEIWKVANPIILEGAAIRKARKLLSLGNSEEPSAFRRWIGKFQSEKNRSTS